MMMIARILIAFVVAMLLFIAGGLVLPREVDVARSIDIQRPVSTVFTLLNRAEAVPAWLAWSERDPGVDIRFSGPRSGIGARMDWSGDPRQVGTGRAEIIESHPDSKVRAHLVIERQAAADTVFEIVRVAGGARVTWTFSADLAAGKGPFGALVSRYFGLLFDRWIGGDLEHGLRQFRAYAESLPAADFSGIEVELIEVAPVDVLYVSRPGGRPTETAAGLAQAYREITAFMAANGIQRTAQPLSIVRGVEGGQLLFEAAIPVHRLDVPETGNVRWGRAPSGPAARTVHRGGYDGLGASHGKLAAWLAANGHPSRPLIWEQYVTDPAVTRVDERITHLYAALSE